MEKRIKEKIEELGGYLGELSEIKPLDFEDYKNNFKTKAACERYFEKIIEAAVDLAFLLIKENRLQIPEDDKGTFDVLSREGIINQELAIKLKEAKGMRNIIAHEYGVVDDELVFESITEELEKDVKEFIRQVEDRI